MYVLILTLKHEKGECRQKKANKISKFLWMTGYMHSCMGFLRFLRWDAGDKINAFIQHMSNLTCRLKNKNHVFHRIYRALMNISKTLLFIKHTWDDSKYHGLMVIGICYCYILPCWNYNMMVNKCMIMVLTFMKKECMAFIATNFIDMLVNTIIWCTFI